MHACQTWMPSMCVRVIWKKIQKRREKQERVVDIECANAMQTNTIHNVRYTSCTCNSINAANWQAKHNFALKNPFKTWKPEPSKWFCLWPFCKTGFFASLILLFALYVCIFLSLCMRLPCDLFLRFSFLFFVRETINSGQLTSTHWFNRRESSHLKHSFWNSIKSWAHQRN